jgi:glycosyltransferase involved in cell wall biosynthesis
METNNKLKVVWVCHFSNEKVRNKISFSSSWLENALRILFRKQKSGSSDFANWISSGIKEFEKFDNVELHVISPHYGMKYKTQEFVSDTINYWFFKPDDDYLYSKFKKIIVRNPERTFERNRRVIKKTIEKIKPDLIHLFGAENPYYSISVLDIDTVRYPLFVTLQTLMSHPEFLKNYPIEKKSYDFRTKIERNILQHASYLGWLDREGREIIWREINTNAIFLDHYLCTPNDTARENNSYKEFDFVYFAASIDKAADLAIEAFALLTRKIPHATLNIVGGAPEKFKLKILARISELGIIENVLFSGKLATHSDVFTQINKSKFALLPLKVDIISGTIREAIFAGLPVVTTATQGTPSLNENRESVLISEIGDHEAMANNMFKLMDSEKYANTIKDNAILTANELWNSSEKMKSLVCAYAAIYDHFKYGKVIPAEIGQSNPNL